MKIKVDWTKKNIARLKYVKDDLKPDIQSNHTVPCVMQLKKVYMSCPTLSEIAALYKKYMDDCSLASKKVQFLDISWLLIANADKTWKVILKKNTSFC